MTATKVKDYRTRQDQGAVKIVLEFYEPPLAYAGDTGKADVYVYTSDPAGLIDKPVIVLDGFDPGNAREWDGMHELLSEQGLLQELLNDGCDVIFVNPVDGGDYVQRTAFVLVDVINWVNQQKKSDTKNVVVGPSTGGIVARYALAHMEKSGMNHDTILYVSWDAPHQGANIPLGNQHFISFFARHPVLAVQRRIIGKKNLRAAKEGLQGSVEGKQTLDRVATRQLLFYHYADQDPGRRPERATLMAELDELGYPRLTRNVAITNGGRSGESQFDPGKQMVSWLDDKGTRYRADCATWAIGDTADPHDLFRCKEAEIFGRKSSGSEQQPVGMLPLDSAPGSTIDTTGLIADRPNPSFWVFGKKRLPIGDIKAHVESECHIPTLSALGVPFTPETLFNPIPADIATPFDAVYMPEHNQKHVQVTEQNKDWVLGEIRSALNAEGPIQTTSVLRVALRAHNGQYVCAEAGGGRELVANRDEIHGWETFELIDLGNENVALRAHNGQYVCAEAGGGRELVANRDEIHGWETFELIDLGNENVALRAHNGQYVCAEAGGGRELVANRDEIHGWETFQLTSL